jgi:hypothetical protein
LLASDPELEVESTTRDDFRVSLRGHSDREQNYEYLGTLLPVAGGGELRT